MDKSVKYAILFSLLNRGSGTVDEAARAAIAELQESKGELYKLYFDGAMIYRSYTDWEEGNAPLTFADIYNLCYKDNSMCYIGDGQMKYYPQLDLNVPQHEAEAIEFMSIGQLNGKNFFTRVIINADNEVRTDQITDAPTSMISKTIPVMSNGAVIFTKQ